MAESGCHPNLSDRAELVKLYIDCQMSLLKIALKKKVPEHKVKTALLYHDIPVRERINPRGQPNEPHPRLTNRAELTELYIDQGRSVTDIAHEKGVSKYLVMKALTLHGIPIRKRFTEEDKLTLYAMHHGKERLSLRAIASRYTVKEKYVSATFRRLGIPVRRPKG